MRNTLETRLGLFFALALIAIVIIFEMVGGLEFFKPGSQIRARFDSIQELKVGDPVKMAGVQIGRVDAITLTSNKVEVSMKLLRSDQVRTDSKASIRFVGLLGQNYVAIDFGSPRAPAVTEGTLLETIEYVDLSTIMVKLDNVATGVQSLTKSFTGDSLHNLLGPFTDFLKENSPRITELMENLRTISGQISQGQGTVGKLIMEDKLYTTALDAVFELNATAEDIKLTLADARSVVSQVNSGQGTLGRLVKDDALYRETTSAMTNLREILEKVNHGDGSAGKLVNDSALYNNAKLTLQKIEKATEGLEDQGPMSVLGLVVNSLF